MVVPENNKTPLTIGLLAHVDAGKIGRAHV